MGCSAAACHILLLPHQIGEADVLISLIQAGGPKPTGGPGFLLSSGFLWLCLEMELKEVSLLSYHQLLTERAVKINSWWGLLRSYQISVWRREATSESWGVLCSSQPEFFPRLASTLTAHAASQFKDWLAETQMHIQQQIRDLFDDLTVVKGWSGGKMARLSDDLG